MKRECTHPQARHRHGTRAAYVRDRRRCPDCTAANTAASRTVARERIYGRWHPYVDAGPVRERIVALRAAGIGVERIAELAGLSVSHIRQLAQHDRGDSPTTQRVRPSTAKRVLGIHIDDPRRAAGSVSTPPAPAVACKRSSPSAGRPGSWQTSSTAARTACSAA